MIDMDRLTELATPSLRELYVTRAVVMGPLTAELLDLIDAWQAADYDSTPTVESRLTEVSKRLLDSAEVVPWALREGEYDYDTILAASEDDAIETAIGNVDATAYDRSNGTVYVDVTVRCPLLVLHCSPRQSTVPCDQDEPDCDDDHEHEWQSPHSVVGGIDDNPGVYGHGGGVIITEVCAHCGAYRVTDTWADEVTYREADEASRRWVDDTRTNS